MACNTALLILQNTDSKPLMLQSVLFCPVLTWVCQELQACGVERFFVVCDDAFQGEAADALAGFEDVSFFTENADALDAAGSDEIIVIAQSVLPIAAYGESSIYQASASSITDVAIAPAKSETPLPWMPLRSPAELQRNMPLCREILYTRYMEKGVTIIDPSNTYIDPRCTVASDVTILPGTILRGHTVISSGCEIGPNSMICDSFVDKNATVNASQVNESYIGQHTTVGPFAYVRPNCHVGDHCRIGDFVELKNSNIDDGTKVSHLTYVGDSDVGKRVNFGCGTVTTNYDGHKKYRCTIGDDVFLGCNTNLIAPVSVGDGAYTAAGSTITDDVPENALGIARTRQTNKDGWAAKFRESWKK